MRDRVRLINERIDVSRRAMLPLRDAMDTAESHVYAFGRRFGLAFHEVQYMHNPEAQRLVQLAREAREAWFIANETLQSDIALLRRMEHGPNHPPKAKGVPD